MSNWKYTQKYYPQMASQGYTFATNLTKTDDAESIKWHKEVDKSVKEIEGDFYMEEKRVIVKGFVARWRCGKVDTDMWPVFAKLREETKYERNIRKLNEANDTICLVSGIPYDEVMKLKGELMLESIEANITTGGLQIYANAQNSKVIGLCKKYKTLPEPGVSRFVESAMLR